MSENNPVTTPKIWLISAICGIVAFLGLMTLAGYSTAASLIVGVLVTLLVAILLWIGWGNDDTAATASETSSAPAPAASVMATAPKPETSTEAAAKRVAKAVEKADGDVKAEAPAEKVVPTKPARTETAAKPAPTEATPAKAKAAAPKRAPVAKDGKPALLTEPRGGKADDLKQLKGVGPKLEQTLNALGIYHFDQIAGLRKREIEWVDNNLRFKGRIERDGWVAQAKALAKGEETEFSKRVKKGDVY